MRNTKSGRFLARALAAAATALLAPAAFGGAGNCCVANGSPGCDDNNCEAIVCAADPFCCDNTWDRICASAAAADCGICAANEGDCCEDNGSPGCEDVACQGLVCAADPFCCDNQWDAICADAAGDVCEVCLQPTGACCVAGQCSVETAADCAALGGAYQGDDVPCDAQLCATGDCCAAGGNGTPGCNDPDCEALICGQDSFCCDTSWDGVCASAAQAQCGICGGCCQANGTPGCNDQACEDLICAQDSFCCDTSWDGICAEAASEQCNVCNGIVPCVGDLDGDGDTDSGDLNMLLGGFGCAPAPTPTPTPTPAPQSDCCIEGGNGSPSCDDSDCKALICGQDPFCCDTSWDGGCAAAANEQCAVCAGDDCVGDLDGDGDTDSADLNILLGDFGCTP